MKNLSTPIQSNKIQPEQTDAASQEGQQAKELHRWFSSKVVEESPPLTWLLHKALYSVTGEKHLGDEEVIWQLCLLWCATPLKERVANNANWMISCSTTLIPEK